MAPTAGDSVVFAFGILMLVGALLTIPTLRYIERHQRTWSAWARRPYLAVKWILIGFGAFASVVMAIQELQEHRVGLGTGIATMLLLSTVKGVTNALTSHMPGSPAGPARPPQVH